jgi:hypothetical protein
VADGDAIDAVIPAAVESASRWCSQRLRDGAIGAGVPGTTPKAGMDKL